MEIKFNPARSAELGTSQPAARRAPPTSAGETTSFEQSHALEQKLSNIPAARPEAVERARELVADVKYPPNQMLDRIADLLALHMKQ